MKISKILIPIDFSPLSRLALLYALAITRKLHARLTLLNVVESGLALTGAYPMIDAKFVQEHMQQARRMLPALLSPQDRGRLDIRIAVRNGEISDTILSMIRQERADLLVMGTHGRSLIARALMGSVADQVLKDAGIPVLTVGHADRFPSFRKILFATDLSSGSREAAAFAADLARVTHTQLVATHVTEVGLEGGAEAAVYLENSRIREARSQLNALMAATHSRDTQIDVRSAEHSVAEAILKSAEEHEADLLVLAIQKKENPEDSSAGRVIREAHIPVLWIPVSAEGKAQETKVA